MSGHVKCYLCGHPCPWPGDDPPPPDAVAVCEDGEACNRRYREQQAHEQECSGDFGHCPAHGYH